MQSRTETFAEILCDRLTGAASSICIGTFVDLVDLLHVTDGQTLTLAKDVLCSAKYANLSLVRSEQLKVRGRSYLLTILCFDGDASRDPTEG